MESSNVFTSRPKTTTVVEGKQVLKFGAILGIIGGLGYIITAIIHGDLPDETTEIALEHIAGRPEWRFLKLAFILSVISWIGFFITMAHTFSQGLSWLISRLSVAVLMIGTALLIVEYSIIGHELKNIADNWGTAAAAEKENLIIIAETMLGISGGLFHSFVTWLIGLPFLLLGLAVLLDTKYSNWIGWIAVVAGGGAFISGATRFLGIELVPYPLLFGGFIFPLNFWLIGMGILLWRRASKLK